MANDKPVEILLVEDNPGDVRLTMEALKEGRLLNRVSVAEDGVEALAFLHQEGKHGDEARPDLILLILICLRRTAVKCWRRSKRIPS